MNKIELIAFRLFQVEDDHAQHCAIQLINGEQSLNELKKDRRVRTFVFEIENNLYSQELNEKERIDIVDFILEYN